VATLPPLVARCQTASDRRHVRGRRHPGRVASDRAAALSWVPSMDILLSACPGYLRQGGRSNSRTGGHGSQHLLEYLGTPVISTRLVERSRAKNTKYRMSPTGVQTSTVKKSAATIACQWARRNFDHGMCGHRSGAGPMPWTFKIRRTVEREITGPAFESSPTIRPTFRQARTRCRTSPTTRTDFVAGELHSGSERTSRPARRASVRLLP